MKWVEGSFLVPKNSHRIQLRSTIGYLAKNSFWLVFWVFDQNRRPWRPPRRCDASTRPMAASSGFYWSPGYAPLGDAPRIAPLHPYAWLGLRVCISPIGIGTKYCNEYKNSPPWKRCLLPAATIILTLCSKSIYCWNPLCKGFILSHFGRACCVGQHCDLIHTIVRKSLVRTPPPPVRRHHQMAASGRDP